LHPRPEGIASPRVPDDDRRVDADASPLTEERRRARRELRRRLLRRRRWTAVAVVAAAATGAVVAALAAFDGPVEAVSLTPPAQAAPPATRQTPVVTGPSIGIAAVGDMTFGHQGSSPPGGADALLRGVLPLLEADFTVGNLETTLGTSGTSACRAESTNCHAFQAQPSSAAALRRAGFDAVNVANNHANDFGADGQSSTTAALRAARLPFTGRPGQITYVNVGRARVALLGFAPYDYAQSLLDIPGAAALVRQAAARAQLVIVLMHVGAEGKDAQHVRPGSETYLGENRGDSMQFAHAVIDAGADLVLGSGPHVLRGLEWYRGRLVAHSLGNFSGFRTLNTSGISGVSAVLHVTLRPDGTFAEGGLLPVRLDTSGTPAPDPSRTALPIVRRLSGADFGAAGARLDSRGAILPPP
jgi:hypothetical protein